MLIFAIITLLGVGGVLFRQTHVRFRAAALRGGGGAAGRGRFGLGGYWAWTWRRAGAVFRPETARRIWSVYKDWTDDHYPGWTRWLFAGLTVSFLYQAASGVFFGVFFLCIL